MTAIDRRPLSPSQAHNTLVRLCVTELRQCGIPCRVIQSGKPTRRRTWTERTPDIVGAIPPTGRLFAVECKTGEARMSDGQREFFTAFDAAGALCIEARALPDLQPIFDAMNRGRALLTYARDANLSPRAVQRRRNEPDAPHKG